MLRCEELLEISHVTIDRKEAEKGQVKRFDNDMGGLI